MLDIKGNADDTRAARLSNFTDRTFHFGNIPCVSLEGIFQALKCKNISTQAEMCLLRGKEAKKAGAVFDISWKQEQRLWWLGLPYQRSSHEYSGLITSIYDAVYEQDANFKIDLLVTGYQELRHSIGNPDMRDTMLTEIEMLYQLNRLRIRALGEAEEKI